MRKKNLLFTLLLTLLFSALSVAGAWGKVASGLIMMDVNLSHHAQGKEVQLWIPYPESDAHQTITEPLMHGDYAEAKVLRDKVFDTPMLYARWEKDASTRKLSLSFQAKRKEVTRPDFPAPPSWDPLTEKSKSWLTRLPRTRPRCWPRPRLSTTGLWKIPSVTRKPEDVVREMFASS